MHLTVGYFPFSEIGKIQYSLVYLILRISDKVLCGLVQHNFLKRTCIISKCPYSVSAHFSKAKSTIMFNWC